MDTTCFSPMRRIAASIEVSAKAAATADLTSLLPRGGRVYLPDIGAESEDMLVNGARRLVDLGYIAVPHIAARRCSSRNQLEVRIKRLCEDAGVRDVLIIAGDVGRPAGEFSSSIDVLETTLLDRFGISDIGIGGHPDGNPNFSEEAAIKALILKAEFGKRTDANIRIVTQFGFDGRKVVSWARALEGHGVNLPVHIGVAGPTKITTLIKYAAMCGVGNSLGFLHKHSGSLTAFAAGYSPEEVVGPIEKYALANPETNVKQIHVFSFGGVKNAADWLTNRGSWSRATERTD